MVGGEKKPQTGLRELAIKMWEYLPGTILPAVLTLVTAMIFTRIMSTDEYGKYGLCFSIAGMLSITTIAWLQAAVSRYLPTLHEMEEISEFKKTLVLGLAGLIVLEGLLTAIGWFWVERWLPLEYHKLYWSTLLLLLSLSTFNLLGMILQSEMQARKFTRFTVSNAVSKLVGSLLFSYIFLPQAEWVLYGTALGTLVLLPSLWRTSGLPNPLHLSVEKWQQLRKFSVYGGPMIGWSLAAAFLSMGDRYVIQWLCSPVEVGIYIANTSLITGAVGLLNAPVLMAAQPFLMQAWGRGNVRDAGWWLGNIADWFALSGILLVAFVWLVSKDLAHWFLGADFRGGHVIMPVTTAGFVLFQLSMYSHKPLEFKEKTQIMLWAMGPAVITNFAMSVWLIPQYGYLAAAYGNFAGYAAYTLAVTLAGKRILPWTMQWKQLLVVIGGTAICSMAAQETRNLAANYSGYWCGLIVGVGIMSLWSSAVLYKACCRWRKERLGFQVPAGLSVPGERDGI